MIYMTLTSVRGSLSHDEWLQTILALVLSTDLKVHAIGDSSRLACEHSIIEHDQAHIHKSCPGALCRAETHRNQDAAPETRNVA